MQLTGRPFPPPVWQRRCWNSSIAIDIRELAASESSFAFATGGGFHFPPVLLAPEANLFPCPRLELCSGNKGRANSTPMGLATPHLTISSSIGHFVPFVPHCLRESWNSPRVFPIAPRTRIGLCAGFGSPGSTTSGSVIGGSGISPGFSIGGDAGSGTGISRCGGSGGISTGGMPGSGAGGRGTWSAWSASNFSKTNILYVPLTVSFEDDDEANARLPA